MVMRMTKEKLLKILAEFGISEPEKVILETDSAYLINTTPHELKFDNGSVLPGSVELAKILKATPKEAPLFTVGNITIVKTEWEKNNMALKLIEKIKKFNEESDKPALLISSIISVSAYGFPVVSPIAHNPRAPPNERIMFTNKFNSWTP